MKFSNKQLVKTLRLCTILAICAIFFLIAGCNSNPKPLQVPGTYKQPSAITKEDVVMNNLKIEDIVEYINKTNAADNSKFYLSVAGTVITLLMMVIAFFMKKVFDTNTDVLKTVAKLITQGALTEQWQLNMSTNCTKTHSDLDGTVEKIESQIENILKRRKL